MTPFLRNMNHWNVVLREVFLVPPALLATAGIRLPETIGELADLAGLSIEDTRKRLAEVDALQSAEVEIMARELETLRAGCARAGQEFILLDVRSRAARSGGCPVSGLADGVHPVSVHDIDFAAWLRGAADSCVVTIGRDVDQAWSAAMYLRSHGIPGARALDPGSDFPDQAQDVGRQDGVESDFPSRQSRG